MSKHEKNYPALNCIDGETTGSSSLCQTLGNQNNPCPWLLLEFQEEVEVFRVDIYNRIHPTAAARTKNLEVRLTNAKPTTVKSMYTGGRPLGIFKGPGTSGQIIKVEGPPQVGKYVLIQMKNTQSLTLREVLVFGSTTKGKCQNRARKGKLYRGEAQSTKEGTTCKNWKNSTQPQVGDHNYCRNPDEEDDGDSVWCYITEEVTGKDWRYCDVPFCGETGEPASFLLILTYLRL